MRSLMIHGRQPGLSRAELESLFGAQSMQVVGEVATLLDIAVTDISFARLGGTVKLARVLTILDTTDWRAITAHLEKTSVEHAARLPAGKLTIGLSVYDLSVPLAAIERTGLQLKRLIRASGRPVRLVPNKEPALNSAQILHNELTAERGWELLFVRFGQQTILAQTTAVQDIEAYTARDQARPRRDARVGMLPPKLAQTIINLAAPKPGATILDPFCGSGVILQEALLMGFDVYGTDIDERMVEYTEHNLRWLAERFSFAGDSKIEVADATVQRWSTPFDVVASETYLGHPFTTQPTESQVAEVRRGVDVILRKFLENLRPQTKPGFRLCLAIPAWFVNKRFQHLPLLDRLEEIGYTRLSFEHARGDDLIYRRPDQFVGRELVILKRV